MNGVDAAGGLTTPNLIEAETKRWMIHAAKQTILVADHSKFGQISFAKVAELSEIHHCIVDAGVSEQAISDMEAEGIKVTIAGRISS
ncbi:Glucitol operon repressor [compost metagenome]